MHHLFNWILHLINTSNYYIDDYLFIITKGQYIYDNSNFLMDGLNADLVLYGLVNNFLTRKITDHLLESIDVFLKNQVLINFLWFLTANETNRLYHVVEPVFKTSRYFLFMSCCKCIKYAII